MSLKAHRVRSKVIPSVKQKAVIEFSCPSGCVSGYLWTTDPAEAERLGNAIRSAHLLMHDDDE